MKCIGLIVILTFLQVLGCLYAQPPALQNQVKTRLVLLGARGQIRGVGLWKDGEFEELRITSTYFPKAVEYAGPNSLTLVSMVPNEEGVEVPFPVGQAQIPEGAMEVLLIMLPLPAETSEVKDEEGDNKEIEVPTRYRIKVVDFSPAIFPETSFLLWNLSRRPLVGIVGDKPFRAEPNNFVLIQPELQGQPRALDAKIIYADDSSKKSYTSRKWFLSPGEKCMMIMTADPGDPNRYLVKTIRY